MAYTTNNSTSGKKRISFNSPVILGFTLLCLAAYLLNVLTHGYTNRLFFMVYH